MVRKRRSCRTEMRRSDSLNSYGIFQPSAPNLRRSWITAWKKVSEKTSGVHATALSPMQAESKNSGSEIGSDRKEPSMLARRPLGGSFVILTPFWSTETGKCFEGDEVSQRRKSMCARSGVISSQIFSSAAIHEVARWQFCSTTHPPEESASLIIRWASGPCPCPSDMACVRRPPNPRVSANLSSCDMGSCPGERMKTSGEVLEESA
mmetsp:Transcript_2346/g.7682  ORF Transcript_2346/g.7682 Transcript_2346/m.7682 type:complete len:207 (-) Transcript_2346:6255-6875(-)